MKTRSLVRLATAAAAFLPALALAHPGHGDTSSFVDGALHPLSGADHLAGLLAAGVLISRVAGRYVALLAATLLGVMVAAGTSDSDGWQFAAGFLSTSAGLIAVFMAGTMAATRLWNAVTTASGPHSPT